VHHERVSGDEFLGRLAGGEDADRVPVAGFAERPGQQQDAPVVELLQPRTVAGEMACASGRKFSTAR